MDAPLEILAADPTERKVLVVDFSDGTTAYFTVEQLMKLRCSRIRTGHWPSGGAMPDSLMPSRAPAGSM